MTDKTATDYALTKSDAGRLSGIPYLPEDIRRMALARILDEIGPTEMVRLFSQFIGLANSVVANNREMIEMLGITSGDLHPHDAHQINLPTIQGALNGVRLAADAPRKGMCQGCAFRLGTPANQSPVTTLDAEYSINERDRQEFLCHERLDRKGRPKSLCAGFATRTAKR